MGKRKHLRGVRKSRNVGARPKHNKKSVTERRRLRLSQDRLLNEYFIRQQRVNQ